MNLRNIIAIILGLVIAFSAILVLEEVGHQIYPPSQEILDAQQKLSKASPADKAEVREASEHMKQAMQAFLADAPLGSMLMVMMAWLLGALFGSFAASALANDRRMILGLVIGIMVFVAVLVNFLSLPYHPSWMVVSSLILVIPFAYAGSRLGIFLFPLKNTHS